MRSEGLRLALDAPRLTQGLVLALVGLTSTAAGAQDGAVQETDEAAAPRERPDRGPRIDEGRDLLTEEVTALELEAHVGYLSQDLLAGRETGSAGEALAVAYIAERLEAAGWQPGGDDGTFLQRVPLSVTTVEVDPSVAEVGTDAVVEWRVDYTMVTWAPLAGEFDVVVAEDLDSIPFTDQALFVPASTSERASVLAELAARGDDAPALVILPGPSSPGRPGGRLPSPRMEVETGGAIFPVLRARGEFLGRIEAGTVGKLAIALEAERVELSSHNVVAILPGAGSEAHPELAGEVIVLSAHLDHIGTTQSDDPEADLVYNGADDDASGVAAVIEVAEALALGPRPARTFVALLATGEERGLLGTREYLRRPARPLAETIYNLNFEMLGRPDALVGGPGHMWFTGYELTNVGPLCAELGVELTPDPRPEQRFFQRSDNYAFVMEGIVAQTLSSFDLHDDYHQVTDEWWTVDYDHMEQAVTVSAKAAALLGSGAVTPAWNEGMQPAQR
ncbi:M28 family peptidase [Engelhardtia mirabilis]|uniref:Alkaline phosphatase isozyme conversion aminopeptidase n=1 Tax=Engelhardtia mirabilis TaxID=2528011 RepID=A0A518BN07_9BACT|nr:alkaline phosphatase isozyme conversion aminopeptidase [Planctomycetes bacterium Pla133]QDV02684.1 alkaline phosphatase isozyme conversion aminopeptidase [Planctomycetes bacterium Pla86]